MVLAFLHEYPPFVVLEVLLCGLPAHIDTLLRGRGTERVNATRNADTVHGVGEFSWWVGRVHGRVGTLHVLRWRSRRGYFW